MKRDDGRVRHQVVSVAESLGSRRAVLTSDIQDVIERARPTRLRVDDTQALLHASIAVNIDTALGPLEHSADVTKAEAPVAAIEYARRQHDVPAVALIRAYRVSQTRFLRHCIEEPASGLDGFRRTHRQALTARSVALAAGPEHAHVTPFIEVAPIAMLCADLDWARSLIHETLGDLATDTPRNAGLRETTVACHWLKAIVLQPAS